MPSSLETEVDLARKEFFAVLGEAISTWYWVELRLFYMLSKLVGFADYYAAGSAFASVVNFRARLTMVDAAFQTKIEEENLQNEWKRLHKRLRKHARKRNEIAHLSVTTFPQIQDPEKMVFLSHNLVDATKDLNPVYLKKDVARMIGEFRTLMHDFQDFVDRLPEPMRHSEYIPPARRGLYSGHPRNQNPKKR